MPGSRYVRRLIGIPNKIITIIAITIRSSDEKITDGNITNENIIRNASKDTSKNHIGN